MSSRKKAQTERLSKSVKFKGSEIHFDDPRVNIFWNNIVSSPHYDSLMHMILSRVYYNVDFFMSDAEESFTIEDYVNNQLYLNKVDELENVMTNQLTSTVTALEGIMQQSMRQNEERAVELNKKLESIDKILSNLETTQSSNKDLRDTINQIHTALSENTEAMEKLKHIKVSGASITEVVQKSEQTSKETDNIFSAVEVQAARRPTEVAATSEVPVTAPVRNSTSEEFASSDKLKSGAFSFGNLKKKGVDLRAARDKMKSGG